MTSKTASDIPLASLVVREHNDLPFYEAFFRHAGRQVKRRIGPAWLERSETDWVPRRGRVREGYYDARRATVRAAEIVAGFAAAEVSDQERKRLANERAVTFRVLSEDYLIHLEKVAGAKPSTLNNYRRLLAEPGSPSRRRRRDGLPSTDGRTKAGLIMAALGDLRADEIQPRDVSRLLASIAETGVSARSVNLSRALISAIYNRAMKADAPHPAAHNPAAGTAKRQQREPAPIDFYNPEEVELLARTLDCDGLVQDGEAVRLAAYLGLRLGELLELRWGDVRWGQSKVVVARNLSDGVISTPKSGKRRDIPLSDPAAAALDRLSRREDFTSPDDLVIVSPYGRHIDGSALRRRFKAARDQSGLRPLRWHDLRHSFGSQLVAGGVDIVTVQAAMGHAHISTTSRYLHARPATETAARFTRAFSPLIAMSGNEAEPSRAQPRATVNPERAALEALAHLDPESRERLLQAFTR